MLAKYDGVCKVCHLAIYAGQTKIGRDNAIGWVHEDPCLKELADPVQLEKVQQELRIAALKKSLRRGYQGDYDEAGRVAWEDSDEFEDEEW